MAKTLTGTAGVNFNITTTNTSDNTGTSTILHEPDSAVTSVTYTNSSYSVAYAGQVGTSGTTIDLYAIADANDGTYYMRLDNGTSGISYASILSIVIHNKATSGTITIQPGATNSFLTASEQITLAAGQAIQLVYSTAKTVSNTIRNFKLVGSTTNMNCEVYILGS